MPFIVTGSHLEDRGYYEVTHIPGWNAGARTISSLLQNENGAYTFSVGQATGIVCGFNYKDNDADYLEIRHGFYIENGQAKVIETGTFKTGFFSYTTETSVFKVERVNGVVKYYIDDVLIYTSLSSSTKSVFLDCSLFSANDTIIDVTLLDSSSSEYGPSLLIELPRIKIGFIADLDYSYAEIELPSPQITIETPDTVELHIELSTPELTINDGVSYCDIVLPAITLEAFDTRIIPDYAILQFNVAKPILLINEEEHLTLDIEIPLAVSISLVPDYLYIDLPQPVISMDYYYNDVLWLQWPRWSLTIFDNTNYLINLHEVTYGNTVISLHRVSYEGTTTVIHLHESSWSQQALSLHSSSWSDSALVHAQALHSVAWQSIGTAAVIALHDAAWSSIIRSTAQAAQEAIYGTISRSPTMGLHDVQWASAGSFSVIALHESRWQSSGGLSSVFSLHDASWSFSPNTIGLHQSTWKSVISTMNLHEVDYETYDTSTIMTLHVCRYRSNQVSPIINTGLIYARI